MADLTYSIVIPCHNEAGNIGPLLERLDPLRDDCEVIVVDDGSQDATFREAQRFPWVTVVRCGSNQGKGRALARGVELARGQYVIFLDGDGQDPPEDLPVLVQAAEEGTDFVNGSKFIGTLAPGAMSFPNYLGNRFMSGLINLLFGTRITDSQSGFRCIRTDFLRNGGFCSAEYEVETEMLLKAIKQGLRVREVPVRRLPRGKGSTGFKRVRNGLRILSTILKERLLS